jgi:predicted phosphodiesterase
MRIAAVSDIHGNLLALDAVLEDIRIQGADVIVNLGDLVSGPLQPRETAARLIALHAPTIRGNHERYVLRADPARMGPSDRYAFETLLDEQRDWIASLPATAWLQDSVLLVHGTPRSDEEYFLETVTEHGCRAATTSEILERTGDIQASLILCGHTHVPRAVLLEDGRTIVNPGSVGLQAYQSCDPFPHRIETGSAHARYALIERRGAGWKADLRGVAYDWNTAAELALQRDRIDWHEPLKSGRVA